MQVAIVAGGVGTRLKSRTGDLPKPMIEICGKPLLEHQIEFAKRNGAEDIALFLGYKPEMVRTHFGDGSRFGVRIAYHIEGAPLGTAGAVLGAIDSLAERFFVLYGDLMVNVDLRRFAAAHARSGASASLLVHPNDHPFDSDLIELDAIGDVMAFHPCPRPPLPFRANVVNAALYLIEREAVRQWREIGRADFVKDLFPAMLAAGQRLHGYRSPEYLKDAGTPDRFDAVVADCESGRVARSSLATPAPGVFLDRDGTLNEDAGFVTSPDQLRVIPGVPEAVRRLNRAGYRTVVVTNQAVIARGDCTESDLQEIHNKLESELGEGGAYVDAIRYCPHHPDAGFAGERAELKGPCECRKPAPGLVRTAAADLNIDLARSWFIGDTTIDVATAANAGVRSVLIQTGQADRDARHDVTPDAVCADLGAAVEFILSESSATLTGTP